MKKVLFIDRDGTILEEPDDEQIDSLDKFTFVPGVISALAKIRQELEYEFVLITNQDGLGTASFPEDTFWPAQNLMLDILASEGIVFDEILIDRSLPADNAPTRKPGTALLTHYIKGDYDLSQSFVLGDRASDIQLAENLGAQAIFIGEAAPREVALATRNWGAIYQWLKERPRTATVSRKSSETQIEIEVNLDGTGNYDIATGLGFFDHMLAQIARHGNFDLNIQVQGDLEVDEHHTIEDTALALGQAFSQALGDKKGIGRYGFVLPMDDCLAQVAIDFGGRPWLIFQAEFLREKVGDMPTEMFMHFFKSFSDAAGCNLNIQASGNNEHHKIEAIFKGFARSMEQAAARTGSQRVPTTKGFL